MDTYHLDRLSPSIFRSKEGSRMVLHYKYIGFVGCYTSAGQADPFESSLGGVPHDRSRVGRGILAFGVDGSGNMHFLNDGEPIIEGIENPSYLCILGRNGEEGSARPALPRAGGLCVVSEVRGGEFQSYSIGRDVTRTGEIIIRATAIGTALGTGGSYPCHVMSSNVGDDLVGIIVSNYGEDEGVLSIFVFGDGSVGPQSVIVALGPGSNVNPDRQISSHAHSASVTRHPSPPSSMDLCCADLGSDVIVRFSLSITRSNECGEISLSCAETERISAPPGSGPRSIMFNPVFGDIAIVSLEMTAQVWLIRKSAKTGGYESLGEPVSLLPQNWPKESDEDYRFNHGRWASDALWSPCGKFAYAAARLHNSITVFNLSTIADSSSMSVEFEPLRFVQRVSTEGLTPRCLCMSECGQFIFVAHQHSHDISSFGRNESDGTIEFIDRLDVPNAACVKLIRPDCIGQH
ncbi:hypothetical protein ACHAXA_006503 [Cyclostephanos tholiformis]|uniref:Uncharacterized protein n=1 Tax=Cyclostephanos tholiformis TaxID=382380 RepID=A0ABD3RZE5_9STRA